MSLVCSYGVRACSLCAVLVRVHCNDLLHVHVCVRACVCVCLCVCLCVCVLRTLCSGGAGLQRLVDAHTARGVVKGVEVGVKGVEVGVKGVEVGVKGVEVGVNGVEVGVKGMEVGEVSGDG